MPIGALIDCVASLLGAITGNIIGDKLNDEVKNELNKLFGYVAIGIAVTLIVKASNLGAVALSIIFGTIIGIALRLNNHIKNLFSSLIEKIFHKQGDDLNDLLALFMLCCFSGTGIFGTMNEALSGNRTTIICKAILDFFTVMIFATKLKKNALLVSIPQLILLMVYFYSASLISPLFTDVMSNDFSAVGGIIELMIAFNILKISNIKAINALPALLIIFVISPLWVKLIAFI